MTFILKGIDKNGQIKYQSRVYSNIDKVRDLRTRNKVSFPNLTFVIYGSDGKVVVK